MKPGDLIARRFEIDSLVSTGGMGSVYRARDRSTGEVVAIKSLRRPEAGLDRSTSEPEAEVLAELRHPGIVRYVAHGREDDGKGWLATEWLTGEDLGAHLAREPQRRLGATASMA